MNVFHFQLIITSSKLNFATTVIYLNKSKTYLWTQPWPLSCMNFLWCKQLHNNSSTFSQTSTIPTIVHRKINLNNCQKMFPSFYKVIKSHLGSLLGWLFQIAVFNLFESSFSAPAEDKMSLISLTKSQMSLVMILVTMATMRHGQSCHHALLPILLFANIHMTSKHSFWAENYLEIWNWM